jgi:hypothetical protein
MFSTPENDLCLDRSRGRWLQLEQCTGLIAQQFVKLDLVTKSSAGLFVLQAADDAESCVDVFGEHGPAVEMWRCKGLRTFGNALTEGLLAHPRLKQQQGGQEWRDGSAQAVATDGDRPWAFVGSGATDDNAAAAPFHGLHTPGCRITTSKAFRARVSSQKYTAFVLNQTSGSYITREHRYCANPTGSGHAPEVYSSDTLDLKGCMAKCVSLQCTCFDFNNLTAPTDTCSEDDFIIDLDDVECLGLQQPGGDHAVTPEACAMACCAAGSGCEVWQFTTAWADNECWIGKMASDSCFANAGWKGGGRPSPNQMFSMSPTGQSVQSSQYVTEDNSTAVYQLCMHAKQEAPMAVEIPDGTPVKLEPCNGQWNQQFEYYADSTIRLSSDPTSCLDGMARGPGEGEWLFTHMWKCYDDPTLDAGTVRPAQEHQVSGLPVCQLIQIHSITGCCLSLSTPGTRHSTQPPDVG